MNLKQFVGFCYDSKAEELGFVRYKNEYYKIGEDYISVFALGTWSGNRVLRPLIEILPLCGELHTEKMASAMIQILGAYWRHTGKDARLDFSSKSSAEECESIRAFLLDVFYESEERFLEQAVNLQTAFEARKALKAYDKDGTLGRKIDYLSETNDWMFLLALKQYDAALDNFNCYAKDRGMDLLWEGTEEGEMHRLLINQRYDDIEQILLDRKQKNIDLLASRGLIRLTDKHGNCQGDGSLDNF